MHWFTRISIAKRWVTLLIAAAIIGGSIFGTLQLKTELMPDIELPFVVVFGSYPGHSPEQVMNDISKPVEAHIEGMPGLKHVESTSMEGAVQVMVTFDYGMDMKKVASQIEDRMEADPVLSPLMETDDLMVTRISMEMIPLIALTVSSENDLTSAQMRLVAEQLVDEVSVVKGILQDETPFMKPVDIEGGDEDALVIPRVEDMNLQGIPLSWILAALQGQEAYESLDAVRSAAVFDAQGIQVAELGDVTDVVEPQPSAFANERPSISIVWRKDPEANTVDVANAIMSKVREFEKAHDGVSIYVVMDQSDYIEDSINSLAVSALIGVVLAALVVFLFLWAPGASLIITVSIPVSILIAFLLMYAFDVTINIFTLGGLAIAVGRIVDNSIVSLENIHRHLQRGSPFSQASIDGIKEVAMPITSATIATVAIFIPLMLVGGLVGEMFRPFSLTVTFAMVASLFVALMLVPPLSGFMGKKKVAFEAADNWYTGAYTRSLRWSLRHRVATLSIAVALFLVSMAILPMLGTSFLPSNGEKMVQVDVSMPHANDLDLNEKIKQVEGKIVELGQEYGEVREYYSFRGSLMGEMTGGGTATLVVVLSGDADDEQQADALRDMCLPLVDEPDMSLKVSYGDYAEQMMGGGGLEVWVIGDEEGDLESVQNATVALTERIRTLEADRQIENLESALVTKKTDASKEWKSDAVDQYALQIGQPDIQLVMAQLEGEWVNMRYGWPISQMEQVSPEVSVDGSVTGIMVPGEVKSFGESQLATIEDMRIGATHAVKLSDLADLEFKPAEYNRADGGYAGTIVARIVVEDVGGVTQEVQNMIDDMGPIPGVKEIKMGGVFEQMMEGFSDMLIAIIVAIVIAFGVLAVSFRSWLMAVLIMASLPLASIGAVLALLVTGKPLGMSSMMGILMLVGIVLTNAIVFLTFVDDRRKEGYNAHDALMDAGRIRLRPILMTALTTMIALIPLAVGVGEGVLIAAELGIVVIGGLFSSTLLTLLVIPVLYSLSERFRRVPAVQMVSSAGEVHRPETPVAEE